MKVGRKTLAAPISETFGEPQLLDQAVLQCLVRALDTTLGLASVGADDVDVELVERPAELGYAVAALGVARIDTENTVLVRVEGDRLAMALDVGSGRPEIVEGALALDELQMHQPARRIVDVDEEGALRSPGLEPPVFRAINLDQLAKAVPTVAGLMNLPCTLAPRGPKPGLDHPLAQRLLGEKYLVFLGELLRRKGRAKVVIALAGRWTERIP